MLLSATLLGACAQWPARSGVAVERDVPYRPDAQAPTADLYRPAGNGPFAAVLMVHGGGWNGRDRGDMDRLSRRLADAGYVVLNIDYRLAPAHRYPAAVEDVHAALRWLQASAPRLHLDLARIGGWGYSAGGHLVALAAVRPAPHTPPLAAVVAGGMPSDLAQYPESPIISEFMGGDYHALPQRWQDGSPLVHVSARSPPMFLYHGTRDRLVRFEDSVAMKQALDRAGVAAELHAVRGLGHVATFVLGFGARDAAVDFLERHLGGPGAGSNGAETGRTTAQ